MGVYDDALREGLANYKKSEKMATEQTNEALYKKSFDAFDEQDLSLVLVQVARRMMALRPNAPDVGFWHTALFRVSKFLSSLPTLTEEEKNIIRTTKGSGRVAAVKAMRERTGMRLRACHDVVKEWANNNVDKSNQIIVGTND